MLTYKTKCIIMLFYAVLHLHHAPHLSILHLKKTPEQNTSEKSKIDRKVASVIIICRPVLRSKGQRSRSPILIKSRHKAYYNWRMDGHTIFKLGGNTVQSTTYWEHALSKCQSSRSCIWVCYQWLWLSNKMTQKVQSPYTHWAWQVQFSTLFTIKRSKVKVIRSTHHIWQMH